MVFGKVIEHRIDKQSKEDRSTKININQTSNTNASINKELRKQNL